MRRATTRVVGANGVQGAIRVTTKANGSRRASSSKSPGRR